MEKPASSSFSSFLVWVGVSFLSKEKLSLSHPLFSLACRGNRYWLRLVLWPSDVALCRGWSGCRDHHRSCSGCGAFWMNWSGSRVYCRFGSGYRACYRDVFNLKPIAGAGVPVGPVAGFGMALDRLWACQRGWSVPAGKVIGVGEAWTVAS